MSALAAWDKLPESIRETWKIDPLFVHKVENRSKGSMVQWAAWTSTHRYVWTFLRSRQQWTIRKEEL
jgi:hypothetical protein